MTELIKYNAACKAIAEAKTVDEINSIRDKADACRAAAKIVRNHIAELDMTEIRFLAEIRLSEMLKETPRAKPGNRKQHFHLPTIKDLGLDKGTAQLVVALSKIPNNEKLKALKEWRRNAEQSNQKFITGFYNSLALSRGRDFGNAAKRIIIDESKLRPGTPRGVKSPILVTPEESAALSAAITKESVRLNMLTNRLNDTLSLLREHLNSLDDEDFTALENALDAAVKAFAEGKKNLRRKNVRVIEGGKND